MKIQLVLASLLLLACGSEAAPTPASTVAPAAAPPAPTTPTPAPTPEPAPAEVAAAADPAAPAAAGEAPDVSDPNAVCAAYYDRSVRQALESAERGATEHPGIDVRSALGVGERGAFLAACSAQAPERLRCFTAYAAAHMDECLNVILAPTPAMAAVAPLQNQSLDDLRALVATLPPAAE